VIDYITIIGLVAGITSVIAIMPQVWKTWNTKHARDLSMKWLVINTGSQLLWFTFGVLSKVLPVILTSSFMFLLTVFLITMKRKYD
jgi:MtN3 and saliva related transmembrane protein